MSKTPRQQIEELSENLSPMERQEIAMRLKEQPSTTYSSTAKSLLKYAGKWQGNDLEQCLDRVYETRSKTEF